MTGKQYSVPHGILVLLLCSESYVVQAAASGAAVSPSTPGFLPPTLNEATSGASAAIAQAVTATPNAPLLTPPSSTSHMDMVTITSATEVVSSIPHLEDTPVPRPLPSASSSAVTEAMTPTATSTTLPVSTPVQKSPGNGVDSAQQRPSNVLENNYGAIFGISAGALVVIIVTCMSIIIILDKISRVFLKEDYQVRVSLTSAGSNKDKAGSWRLVGHQVHGNQTAAVQEEEGNASTSDPHQNSTDVASGNHQQLTSVASGNHHKSTSVLSDNHYNPTTVINYKRHHSAGAIGGNHHYLTSATSDSHCCTTIAEVHQNPTFVDALSDSSQQEELV